MLVVFFITGPWFHYFGIFNCIIMGLFLHILVFSLNRRHSVDNFLIRKEINFVNISYNIIFILFIMLPYFLINDSTIQVFIVGYGITLHSSIYCIALIFNIIKLTTTTNNHKSDTKTSRNPIKTKQQPNVSSTTANKHTQSNIPKISIFQVLQNKTGIYIIFIIFYN